MRHKGMIFGASAVALAATLGVLQLDPAPVSAAAPVVDLADAPVAFLGLGGLPAPDAPESVTVATASYPAVWAAVAGESLRVVMSWSNMPTDSLGLVDSTVMHLRASKVLRFTGGATLAANTERVRRHLAPRTADTVKLVKPVIGDSVLFTVDTVFQCRQGKCSAPGSAVWGYRRTLAPPSMTLIRITVDSF